MHSNRPDTSEIIARGKMMEAAKEAVTASKCKCAEHAKTARPGKWECLECGTVWHIPNTKPMED